MVKNLDIKIMFLMNKLYDMDDEQVKEFKIMLNSFSYEEKMEVAYSLRKKVKEEESILKRFLKKVKLLKNDLEDYKVQKKADELLKNI